MNDDMKVYMGSWCFTFGFPEPAELETVVKVLSAFDFDGIALGAEFSGHAPVGKYPTKGSRKELVDMIHSYDLEIAGYAPDPYCMPWATDGENVLNKYKKYFDDCLEMASDIGSPAMRVDPGSFGPIARDADYNEIWDRVVTTFQAQSKQAADKVDDIGMENFKINYDFGHAQAISVLGHNQVQPTEILEGGQTEFIQMLKGKIGDVGINDCDNNTFQNLFGKHLGLGKGCLDYEDILCKVIDSGFKGPWWSLDTIPMSTDTWTNAWDGIHELRPLISRCLEGRR